MSQYEFVTEKEIDRAELHAIDLEKLARKLLRERDAYREKSIEVLNRNIMWERVKPGQPFGDFRDEAAQIVDAEALAILTPKDSQKKAHEQREAGGKAS